MSAYTRIGAEKLVNLLLWMISSKDLPASPSGAIAKIGFARSFKGTLHILSRVLDV